MRVLGSNEADSVPSGSNAIFQGGEVWIRPMAGANRTDEITMATVQFAPGARTKWHTHTSDQLLYVVSGIGKVGDRNGERVISVGDMAHIPAGEEHWHGAADTTSPMAHLAITRQGSVTEVIEE